MRDDDQHRVYKIILIGDPTVGKTSLRRRYMGDGFKANYAMTIGADFAIKRFQENGVNYLIQIWDLSGQTSFKSIRKIYYRNANGVIVVYDVTNPESFRNIPLWVSEYQKSVFGNNIPIMIVGNKIDLMENDTKTNQTTDLGDLDLELNSQPECMFTSALSGDNVNILFSKMIERVTKAIIEQ